MKYIVTTQLTISCYTIVEAEDEGEAKRVASERAVMQLPWLPNNTEGEEWIANELDGEPDLEKMEVGEYGE